MGAQFQRSLPCGGILKADSEEDPMISSKEGAVNYWRAQISNSLTWMGNSTRLLAAALAIRDLAESLCPGVFDDFELADDNPTQKETILGLIAAYQMQSALAVENALSFR